MKSKVRISYPAIPAFDAKGNNGLQIADQWPAQERPLSVQLLPYSLFFWTATVGREPPFRYLSYSYSLNDP